MILRISVFVLLITISGCTRHSSDDVDVVVTNTLLEVAVRDLAGDQLTVTSLATPGMCPGHFDLKPSHVKMLRQARAVVLFDFQQSFAQKLSLADASLLLHPNGGLSVPSTYLDLCSQLKNSLIQRFPELEQSLQESFTKMNLRMQALSQEIEQQTVSLAQTGCPVLCSVHQEAFLRWLHCLPVDTFAGSDTETLVDIESALGAGQAASIRLVVANEPEGTALAQAIAQQLSVPWVVLGNFPGAGETFDDLVRRNVRTVLEGLPL